MRCAGEPEGGLGCTAIPGGNSNRIRSDGQCLAPVCCAGSAIRAGKRDQGWVSRAGGRMMLVRLS